MTVPASPFMAEIHNANKREPAIIRHEDPETWLSGSLDNVFAVLKAYPTELIVAYRISTLVNSPKNNVAELLRAVA